MATNLALDLKPLVAGQVLDDAAALAATSSDFGRMIHRVPGVVVRPASTEDVAAVIRYARAHSVPVATRGEAHTQSGQATVAGGILIDLTSLDRIHSIDAAGLSADCQAGVKWETLVRQTVPQNLVPPVLTNNLGVTIGGTLSVAGLGIASFRFGAQGDNVTEMEVVTGAGDVVACSEAKDREVFDVVRSTLGQFGVITRAKLKLRRCKPKTRTYYLLYDDLGAIMRDAHAIMEHDRVDYLESTCVPCPQGFRTVGETKEAFAAWFFPLHLTVEFDAQSPPDDAQVLQGLAPYRRTHVEDQGILGFAARLEPLFAIWKRIGNWAMAHPWTETIIPWGAAQPFITQVLAGLSPTALGGGHVLLWPCRGTVSHIPYFMYPPTPLVMGFGILPGVPAEIVPLARQRLNMVSDMSMAVGAKRYLSGFIEFDRARWKQHFGPRWGEICRLKKQFDPDGILNPGFIDYGP
ncbi:MAG TPA: FAD-binding protein [Candidatus Polarisedimenticolia bacterium]|nr:FAD-binding protein [Candidatus Polarisedimenticolia bacterium]